MSISPKASNASVGLDPNKIIQKMKMASLLVRKVKCVGNDTF
jgi:hypothetical protein